MDRDYVIKNWLYDADGRGWDISMSTLADYMDECWVRNRYDKDHMRVAGPEYDEYFKAKDEHICSERIGEAPILEDKFKSMLDNPYWILDPYRNDRYMENPQKYCEVLLRELPRAMQEKNGPERLAWETHTYNDKGECTVTRGERDNVAHLAKLPPDLLHLHDAIFHAEEAVENPEIKTPERERHWWDSDVISEEFGYAPTEKSPAEYRVDWYLGHTEKNK